MDREKSIGIEIKTLSNLIKREFKKEQRDLYGENSEETDELTGFQSFIIGYIYKHSEDSDVFQKDIEKEFNIRRSTATGMLQLMEKRGYILREPVEYDARLKKLILTPKAVDIQHIIIQRAQKMEAKLRQGLSEGEIMFFFEVMEKIKKNIEG